MTGDRRQASAVALLKNDDPKEVPTAGRLYTIFVDDLVLPWRIGIHAHERAADQPVRLSLSLEAREPGDPLQAQYEDVVCYEKIVEGVRNLAGRGHIALVESLAAEIAALCLADARVENVRVRVEKPNAIAEAATTGIEIHRSRSDLSVDAARALLSRESD